MRGLILTGVEQVAFRTDLPEPTVQRPTDAVVAVSRAGLCGSDLHPYLGREPVRFGIVPGHEVVGEVTAVGAAVRRFSPGDRVVVPFTTSCGTCEACLRGLSARCHHGQLFGYGPPDDPARDALQGGQAERLRVPLADGTLVPVPDGLRDVDALLLADNAPTGWYAAERAGVNAGDPVAVVGLGAVGLCALTAIRFLATRHLLAVDPVADRRARAAELGAEVADPDEAATRGARFAAVIEAAGTPAAQRLAFDLVRPGGTLSVIAVQTAERFAFQPAEAYDRNLTVRAGRAPVRSVLDRLLPLVVTGDVVLPTDLVVTHPEVPLADGGAAYRRFAAREPGMVKAAFVP